MASTPAASGETTALLNESTTGRSKSSYTTIKTVLSALAVAGVLGALAYFGKRLVTTPKLSELITQSALEQHLKAFEAIAKANGGSRSIALGYNDSAAYIVKQLKENTDYAISIQPFIYTTYENVHPPKLAVAGWERLLIPGKDFDTFASSGSNTIKNARIQSIPSGCSPEDFTNFLPGSVAMFSITFNSKCRLSMRIQNAINAQASAVLFYTTFFFGGGAPTGQPGNGIGTTPVIWVSHMVALEILARVAASVGGEPVLVDIDAAVRLRDITTVNVLADTPAGDDTKVIVAGSHLDSVTAGPGINDDGSGSAATLEVAVQLYRTGLSRKLKNKVRFAWWSGEELGLLGSNYYVDDLAKNNPDELKKIVLNLDNDMIGSPNGGRFIYNGREAEDPQLRGPSGAIQSIYEEFFDLDKKPHETTPFDGRSDYGGFLEHGIPAGGLFAGAEVIKTEEQYNKFGGTPGIPFDPCYHQACDTLENMQGLGMRLFLEMASAIAHSVQKLAFEQDIISFLHSSA
ncbi:hypothetical protein HDU67_009459 [Dinochytrium kinnereticum]|nr:hypothetical protein HDU67_009459 [Dinochytrium kinnereticum]